MNKGLTVKQLFECCKKQIALGNGDKHILISDDDEGNGYHTLFMNLPPKQICSGWRLRLNTTVTTQTRLFF